MNKYFHEVDPTTESTYKALNCGCNHHNTEKARKVGANLMKIQENMNSIAFSGANIICGTEVQRIFIIKKMSF